MEKANQALKQRFEKQFPGTKVAINAGGSDGAIAALLEGKIDLAAIGRPLTQQEKAQGLVQVPLSRQKIAILVGPDNPFKGSLTFDQFARIFRGEITNWSQVGGAPGLIQLIDRPDGSDTRRAFQSYKVFQTAPFKTGANAKKIGKGSTAEVIKQLGKNGISYAIADQALERKDVRILPMHNVLPDSPKYPFSQTLSYVYKGPKPSPAVLAFVGYATDSSNQQIVQQAIATTTTASSVTASSNTTQPNDPNTSAETATAPSGSDPPNTTQLIAPNSNGETVTLERGLSWLRLLLLGIPLLGGLIWWLLKDRKAPLSSSADTSVAATLPATAAGTATAAPSPSHSLLFLVPYDGKNAYAYWQIAPAQIEQLQRRGGEKLMLRLYDVTDIPELERHSLPRLQQFGCQVQQDYLLLTLPAENRDYLAELGYLTQVGGWLPLTRSGTVRVAPSVPTGNIVTVDSSSSNGGTAWLTQTTGPAVVTAATPSWHTGMYHSLAPSHSRLFLVPYDAKNAYAYWEIAPREIEALQRQGGEKLMLRLYDITDIPDPERHISRSLQEFDCQAQERYLLINLPAENRDYMVELGYLTQVGNWLPLTRSGMVRVAASVPTGDVVLAMMLRDSKNVYAYWEIPPVAIEALKHQGWKS
jgi:phosphate transport system substrate-binding protein